MFLRCLRGLVHAQSVRAPEIYAPRAEPSSPQSVPVCPSPPRRARTLLQLVLQVEPPCPRRLFVVAQAAS